VNSTASIAADVISAAGSASSDTLSTPETSNGHEFPDIAGAEYDAYIADDPQSFTRRAAAAALTTLDARPFVSTKQGMARRAYDPPSRTHQIAREAMDLQAFAEGMKADPRDRRAMQAHAFAKDINNGAMANSLPSGGDVFEPGSDEWRQSGDAVIDALARRVLEAK
jgi:hypothetical protein